MCPGAAQVTYLTTPPRPRPTAPPPHLVHVVHIEVKAEGVQQRALRDKHFLPQCLVQRLRAGGWEAGKQQCICSDRSNGTGTGTGSRGWPPDPEPTESDGVQQQQCKHKALVPSGWHPAVAAPCRGSGAAPARRTEFRSWPPARRGCSWASPRPCRRGRGRPCPQAAAARVCRRWGSSGRRQYEQSAGEWWLDETISRAGGTRCWPPSRKQGQQRMDSMGRQV